MHDHDHTRFDVFFLDDIKIFGTICVLEDDIAIATIDMDGRASECRVIAIGIKEEDIPFFAVAAEPAIGSGGIEADSILPGAILQNRGHLRVHRRRIECPPCHH